MRRVERTRVLCIAGTSQNGATLLCRMLGQLPGFVAVGEVGYVWDRGLIENMECGCGIPFRTCPFWTRVGEAAFGGWDRVDAHRALRLRLSLTGNGRVPHPFFLPLILRPGIWPSYHEDLRAYSALMTRLYEAIRAVSEAQVIVDSMKQPYHVFSVSRIPGLDVQTVHLIRDSRGVALSASKWVRRQGAVPGAFRVRHHPLKSGLKWVWINLSFELLSRIGVPSVQVGYEALVRSPSEHVRGISGFAGLRVTNEDLAFIEGQQVRLPPDHLVAGNRVRLQAGPLQLRVDDEWKTKLKLHNRVLVSLLTWPLRARYSGDLNCGPVMRVKNRELRWR